MSNSERSTEVRMSELMTPESANFLGNVFGGIILAMLDKVAYVTASRFAGRTCVTASFDRVDFHSPIYVGELVHMIGQVVYVGRTSVQVEVQVHAENIKEGTYRHTNTCTATLVSIDENHKPTAVPRLQCETREQMISFLKGKARRELSQKHQAELQKIAGDIESLTDEAMRSAIEGT